MVGPLVTEAPNGIAVTESPNGAPVTVGPGGIAVRFVAKGGIPVTGGGTPVPEPSVALNPNMGLTNWAWSGDPTTDGAYVAAGLVSDQTASLLLSTDPTLATGQIVSNPSPSASGILRCLPTGLTPDTTYYYAVCVANVADTGKIGRFKTAPTSGQASFRFIAGSCASISTAAATFDEIRARNPALMFHLGDLQYWDSTSTSASVRRGLFNTYFTLPKPAQMHRELNVVYIYNDHDSAGNNSYGASTGMAAARDTFREIVPARPAASAGEHNGRSVVYGRIRFIVPDLLSQRSNPADADGVGKTMLGAAQKVWFKAELDAAKAANQVVCLVSGFGWSAFGGGDAWSHYATERAELANHMKNIGLAGAVFAVCGDYHAVAWNDGDYATGGGMSVPTFHTSPFDRPSNGGGGATWGFSSWSQNQFGEFEVTDNGPAGISVTFVGRKADGTTIAGSARTVTLLAAEGGGGDATAPTITSQASFSVAENTAFTTSLTANEAVTWSKVGGTDQALFNLDGASLTMSARDYETATDSDANNTYVVQVRATDAAGNFTDQTITVTVTDVAEGGGMMRAKLNLGSATPVAGWNSSAAFSATFSSDLLSDAGAPTGWSVAFIDAGISIAATGAQGAAGGAEFPDAILLNYITDGSNRIITLQVSGMNPAKLYNVRAIGSRSGTGTRNCDFSVNGGTPVTLNVLGNVSNVASFPSVSPNGSGQMTISVVAGSGNTTSVQLNGIIIEELA